MSPRLRAGWGDAGFATGVAAVQERHGWTLAVVTTLPGQRGFVVQPRRWVVEIVFAQLTKPDVLARRGGGQDVADLDRTIGDDHPVNQEHHQLTPLLEGSASEALPRALTECRQRGRHASQFLVPLGLPSQQLLLGG